MGLPRQMLKLRQSYAPFRGGCNRAKKKGQPLDEWLAFQCEASVSFDSVFWRSGRRRHVAAQLAERIRLDLPDTLRRNPVLVGELVERRLVLGHPALLQDVAAALVQAVH